MKTLTAIVTDSKRLELNQDISFPPGTRLRVSILEAPNDYEARLIHYYESAASEALAEERALVCELSAGDASLPPEEPWW